MPPVPVPTYQKCIEVFGNDEGPLVHKQLLKAEFRSASSLLQQIDFLKSSFPKITVRVIIKLLSISNDRYYNATRGNDKQVPENNSPPSRRLLTDEEESELITQIHIQQMQNDCMDGKDILEHAELIYKRRTGDEKSFTRDWLMDFRERNKNSIEKVSADSVDDDRGNIDIDEVNKYIDDIEEMMRNPPNPFLLINFDEIGFGRRPQKGKRKNVYVFKESKIKPYWREETNMYHVSVVTAVSAACCDITPLYISPRKRLDDEIKSTFFLRTANYFSTPKGYMNIESTVFWVRNNLAPYVKLVRSTIGEDERCVIITDGLSSHFNEIVMKEIEEIGNITVIPIPSHSSHISQMLDVTIFNSFKKKYDSCFSVGRFSSEFTKKLMRIKNAYKSTIHEEIIRSGWEKAGFHLIIEDGDIVSYEFSDDFKEYLRSQALHQEPQENE